MGLAITSLFTNYTDALSPTGATSELPATTARGINALIQALITLSENIPANLTIVQIGNVPRTVGTGDFPVGFYVSQAFTATQIVYQFGSADGTGQSSTVELDHNGTAVASSSLTVSAANQADGSGTDAARTATINQLYSVGDRINLKLTAVGANPGNGLWAAVVGIWS